MVSLVLLTVALPAVAAPAPAVPANPLLQEWKTPFGVPPFAEIKPEHFMPAIEQGMAEQKKEIAAIVDNAASPTFANTVEAYDASGELLGRVMGVFQNLVGAETNEALQEIARKTAPTMAAHRDDIALNPKLFERVKAVWDARR